MAEESDFDKGYKAGRRMMAMRVRHHVSPEGAQYVMDVIGEYGGPPAWPPSDSQVAQNATRAKAHDAGVEAERKRWESCPAVLEIKSGDLSPEAVKRINDFVKSMDDGAFEMCVIKEAEAPALELEHVKELLAQAEVGIEKYADQSHDLYGEKLSRYDWHRGRLAALKAVLRHEEEWCCYCGDLVTQLNGMTCPRYDCKRSAQMEAEGVTEEDMARDPADVSTTKGTNRCPIRT